MTRDSAPRPPEPITWTIPYASTRWGISETTGRDLARRGLFPGAFRVPGTRRWLVHVATFQEELARLAHGESVRATSDRTLLIRALSEARAGISQAVAP